MPNTRPLRARRSVLGGLGVGMALVLVGCMASPPPWRTVEGENGPIRAKATLLEESDGACGIGLDVHNTGSEAVEFPRGDWESVGGVSHLEWHIPFGYDSDPEGYDLATELPAAIEASESARIAFVTNCDDGEPIVISVNPIGLAPVVLPPFE